jgi:hypothetical protein
LHFSPYETHMVRLMAWWISLWRSSVFVECFCGWLLKNFVISIFITVPYILILQMIKISPSFNDFLHIYIYVSLEIFSFYHRKHFQISWCLWMFLVVVSLWCFVSTLVHLILSIINLNVQFQPLFSLTFVLFHNLL